METYQNELIYETSLYLQQHAKNPVNWLPWSDDAFHKAATENKLVLVSIGYSSCHWCHVMEHESFEDTEVAALMNKYFVCIKVDREERPDIDQIYMNAVQLMTQRGGWPLNCFTTADRRPIYGGTYFPKDQWMHVLQSLQHVQTTEPQKIEEYASELTEGIQRSESIIRNENASVIDASKLVSLVEKWKSRMDFVYGGANGAPKFPLPNNQIFLQFYERFKNDSDMQKYVDLTHEELIRGGIYDQIGGGFSRYSVDQFWKVPHFEKMLYDNAQLIESLAYSLSKTENLEYKFVINQSIEWLKREMKDAEGYFYASQDADSEGIEGKFYVWKFEQVQEVLAEDAVLFWQLFNPENKGYWEEENWVLLRTESFESFAKKNNISIFKIESWIEKMRLSRSERIAPVTDKKGLVAWNMLLASGLIYAGLALKDDAIIAQAEGIIAWFEKTQLLANGEILRIRQAGKSSVKGFLDDYAFAIKAYTDAYSICGKSNYLEKALELNNFVHTHFYDSVSGMYFYTTSNAELIARKMELNDNVIPATNSVMANNLLTLFHLTDNFDFEKKALQILANVADGMDQYGSGYSNYALLQLRIEVGVTVVKIPKNGSREKLNLFNSPFFFVSEHAESFYQLCANGSCSLPLKTEEEVLETLTVVKIPNN